MLIANGSRFHQSRTSDMPTGAIDLLPTILTLLGYPPPIHLDGRVLWELFQQPQGQPGEHTSQVIEPEKNILGRSTPQIKIDQVGSVSYVSGQVYQGGSCF